MKQALIDESSESSADMYKVDAKIAAKFTKEELTSLKSQFTRFDTDGSGDIDVKELCVIMDIIGEKCTPEQLAELLKEADSDGDGNVSFEEFLNLVHTTKKVIMLFMPSLTLGFLS